MAFNLQAFLRDVQVPAKPPKKPIVRPIGVRYYARPTDRQIDYAKATAASTIAGAVRGAVVHVLLGRYSKALLFDRETGRTFRWVHSTSTGLSATRIERK
jgi:hypothetical protein